MTDRTILHCDCNSFYASVEEVFNPRLKSMPMAVCGDPASRHGIVLAKNQLAKHFNITTGETVFSAKAKCPQIALVAPRHDEYVRYSQMINEIYAQYTDLVEPFGIDESWLDVTDSMHLFGGSGVVIANALRHRVQSEIGLTISVGVSFNKVFAKLGSDYKKPDATTVFGRSAVQSIIWKMPVSELLYVGKSLKAGLLSMGIKTIGELACANRDTLLRRFGKLGEQAHDYANGIDNSPVQSYYAHEQSKSIGNGTTFPHDISGADEIRDGIGYLADSVGRRLRASGLVCSTIQVQIKNPSFHTISRRKTLLKPTHLTKDIIDTAMEIIKENWGMLSSIRAITITALGLAPQDEVVEQLSLFESAMTQKNEKQEKLETTIDLIRSKYGKRAISQGKSTLMQKEDKTWYKE